MRLGFNSRTEISLRMFLLAPFDRIADAPWYAKAFGAVATLVTTLIGSPFNQLLLFYALIVLFDFFTGVALAHKENRYDQDVARYRALGKASGVLYVIAMRTLELIIGNARPELNTDGAVAFGLLLVLVVLELESWDRNREGLTGKPTPLLRPVLQFFRGLAIGGPPKFTLKDGD